MQLNKATPSSLAPSLHCTAASTPQDPKLAPYNSSLPFLYKPFSPTLPAYLQTTSPHPYPSGCGLAHPGVRCSEQPDIKWSTFIRNRGSQLPPLFTSALWCLIRKDEWCWVLGVWRLLPGCYLLPALAGRLLGSMGHGFNTESLFSCPQDICCRNRELKQSKPQVRPATNERCCTDFIQEKKTTIFVLKGQESLLYLAMKTFQATKRKLKRFV